MCGGDTDIARSVDDIGEATLSLAEVKALSTGNPLIMEKAGVDSDVARLERLAASHHAEQRRAAKVIADGGQRLARLQGRLTLIEDAVARRTTIAGDDFSATIDGQHFTKRVDAAAALQSALAAARHRSGQTIPLGQMAGLDLAVRVEGIGGDTILEIGINGVPVNPVRVEARDLRHVHPGGLLTRVTHMVGGLDSTAEVLHGEIARTQADITTAQTIVGQPFDQDQLLHGLKARQASIDQALLDVGDDSTTSAEPAHYPGPDATPQEWEVFLAQFSPDPITITPSSDRTLAAMPTDELDRHVTATRAALAAKERARDQAHQAEERLRHHLRTAPGGEPDDPRLAALARHQADRRRLITDIAALTEQLDDAQTELERRADHPHQPRTTPTPAVPRTHRQPAPSSAHPQPVAGPAAAIPRAPRTGAHPLTVDLAYGRGHPAIRHAPPGSPARPNEPRSTVRTGPQSDMAARIPKCDQPARPCPTSPIAANPLMATNRLGPLACAGHTLVEPVAEHNPPLQASAALRVSLCGVPPPCGLPSAPAPT